MKKYKPNYMFTVMFQLCNLFLSFLPGFFIIVLRFETKSAIYTPILGIMIVMLFMVIGNVPHFIVSLFTKHQVYIDEYSITVKGKKICTQYMNFEDVRFVIFDQGAISKYGNGKPCSICLFNSDCSKNLLVRNPSFFLMVEINKRCKNAKFKFNNYKWYIIWCVLFTAFSTFLVLFS